MKKTIGIICDNYKVERFKTELQAKGFDTITTIKNLPTDGLTSLKITCMESDFDAIGAIFQEVDLHFKALRN